jgi:hypothetical protein
VGPLGKKKTIREAQPPFTKMQRRYGWSRRRHWREKRRDGEVTDCIFFYALKVDHRLTVRLSLRLVPTTVKVNFCSCIYCLMSPFYHIVDALKKIAVATWVGTKPSMLPHHHLIRRRRKVGSKEVWIRSLNFTPSRCMFDTHYKY